MAAENAPKTAGRRFAMLQAVLQPGMSDNPAKFEETWKSWEHQMDIYENLSSTKLDDDVKISVVLRECPQKLRDHLLVNSQQFESNYNKLRAIIQACLNTNKTWIVNDFRETVPMDVDYKGKSKGKGKSKSKSKGKNKGKSVRGVSWSEVATVPKRKSHRGLDLDLSLNSEENIWKGWKESGGTK